MNNLERAEDEKTLGLKGNDIKSEYYRVLMNAINTFAIARVLINTELLTVFMLKNGRKTNESPC